jgi:hypothetical protein
MKVRYLGIAAGLAAAVLTAPQLWSQAAPAGPIFGGGRPAIPAPAAAAHPGGRGAPADAAAPSGDAIDRAVERGIGFLMTQQDPTTGAINNQGFGDKLAVTNSSLAIMAMASVGHTPGEPTPQGHAMARALTFVLREDHQFNPAPGTAQALHGGHVIGYFGLDQSRMYGHGITTLMLAEMLGMGADEAQDRDIRDRLARAIDLIVRSQLMPKANPAFAGGWRYEPNSNDSDLSVTVWQVMALRAAHNAGMTVPADTIQNAVKYIRGSYLSARDKDGKPTDLRSGFGYQPGGSPTYSTAAEGLLAMQVCGEYTAPEVVGASNYLLNLKPGGRSGWFYYGTYYYAQGMYQRGGQYAEEAAAETAKMLLPRQDERPGPSNGSWPAVGNEAAGGPVLTTSLALLSLSVKYHYLPIYQR